MSGEVVHRRTMSYFYFLKIALYEILSFSIIVTRTRKAFSCITIVARTDITDFDYISVTEHYSLRITYVRGAK